MRKSRTSAPHAGANVVDFVPQVPPAIVEQASLIRIAISFFSPQQVANQRKEQS